MSATQLIYVHDPMCSWCWAFAPTWRDLEAYCQARGLSTRYLLGGLAPDTDQPMPLAQRQTIEGYWRRIQQVVPGTRFNFDFWTQCTPRRSTYPACRAVIAAREQGRENDMIQALQEAYYLNAQNPSDESTHLALAQQLGMNTAQYQNTLTSANTQAVLQQEIMQARQWGVQGFPSLLLMHDDLLLNVPISYANVQEQIHQLAQVMGQLPG